MMRMRVFAGCLMLWTAMGAAWLALSPQPGRSQQPCMEAVCVDQFSCMYNDAKYCELHPNYCFSQMCWKMPK